MAWLAVAWLAGAITSLIRVANSWRLVDQLRRSAIAVDDTWRVRFAACASAMGITTDVTLEVSAAIDVPCSVGVRHPAVIMPAGLLDRITPSMFHALSAHELAHVRRKDYAWNLAQVGVEALLFYHPAAWWIVRRHSPAAGTLLRPPGQRGMSTRAARAHARQHRARSCRVEGERSRTGEGPLLERVRDLVAQPEHGAPASTAAQTLAPLLLTAFGIALALSLMVATGLVPQAVSSSWTAWAAAAGLGVAVGLRHAFEPDHVIALATLVTRERSPRSAMRLGVSWGIGHTLSLFTIGAGLTLARRTMPETAAAAFETAVAAMVVVIGVRAVYLGWRLAARIRE